MTLVVAFDGTTLSEAALVRATEFGTVLDEEVLVASVVPERNLEYARDRGWLEPGESFDYDEIVSRLEETVAQLSPDATFRPISVGRSAPAGTISNKIRKVARDRDASMVFVGSDNAGRIAASVSSVARNIATDGSYDVVIVRTRQASKVEKLKEASPLADAEE